MTLAAAITNDVVRDLLATHKIPGVSIAAYHAGELVEVAAGFANIDTRVEANTDTIFQIGSITKVFTATLLLKLGAEGRVDINAPVSRYLPTLRIAGAAAPDTLTVRTLIDYTAGMEGDFFGDFGNGDDALAHYVDACQNLLFVHEPGAMRSYNSTSFCIAGRVIENICGKTFSEVLRDEIFVPFGLERVAFYTHDVARYRTAVGHALDPTTGKFSIAQTLRMPHALGPAGSSVTMAARDLLRFGLAHLYDGQSPGPASNIPPQSLRAMREPAGRAPPANSALLTGWAEIPAEGARLIAASGATIEQNAFLALVPEANFAIAILTNTAGGADRVFLDLGVRLLSDRLGVKIAPVKSVPHGLSREHARVHAGTAAALCGTFRNSLQVQVTYEDSGLFMTLVYEGGSHRAALVPLTDDDEFAVWYDGAPAPQSVLAFIRAEHGRARYLSMSNRLYVRV